ncbi:MAG: hypothetical protein JNM70_07435 [Anaerolineae bacterium]|nr:hypothetical protein [Anaerolineae bacterium]
MPIQTTWGNPEQTVILQEFQGKWNINDLHTAFDMAATLTEAVPRRIDFICDLRPSGLPSGNFLSALRRMERAPVVNTGITIAVGANHYIKALSDAFKTISPNLLKKFFFVDTMEEA